MKLNKILIIEDVPAVVETVSLALEMRWPDAKIFSSPLGNQGIAMVKTESPDIVIIDLGLPGINGFDVLKCIRQFSNVPILILTVKTDESDIVKCLESGADDYVSKPFKQLELLARINGILRRRGSQGEEPLVYGQLRYEPTSRRLMSDSTEIEISRTEGIILGILMENAGNVVSYSSIAEKMWGNNLPGANHIIKVHIRHLREKLEVDPNKPKLILNKAGIGYYLARLS